MVRVRVILFAGLAAAAIGCLLPAAARGGDDPKKDEPKAGKEEKPGADAKPAADAKKEAPATVAVEKGPFTVVVETGGAFEPRDAAEVQYRPVAYGGELEVVESFAGGPVEKGQVLVRLKTEKIDEVLQAAEADLKIARGNLARQTEEGKRQEEATAIALAKSDFEANRSEEALRLFEQVDRPLRIRESEHRLQGTKDSIQDQTEELDQLEKMYKADEVVEATEEIVLKRSRRGLDRSKTWLGFLQQHHDTMLQVDLPRELTGLTLDRRFRANEWDRVQATAPLGLEQSRMELAKSKIGLDRQELAFSRLQKDREALTLVAPQAGVAVAGAFNRGKWSGLEDLQRALRPGQKVGANQTLYTVFTPGSLAVRTSVGEATVFQVKTGQAASVTLVGDADTTLPATVSKVARVSGDGSFEVLLDLGKQDDRLMPGYGCKVKITTSEKADALTVPSGAVGKDGEKTVVYVFADGTSTAKEVKVGATSGGRTEIREGVAAGDKVLESPPKSR